MRKIGSDRPPQSRELPKSQSKAAEVVEKPANAEPKQQASVVPPFTAQPAPTNRLSGTSNHAASVGQTLGDSRSDNQFWTFSEPAVSATEPGARMAALEARTTPFTEAKNVPGGAGGVMTRGKPGRFLVTKNLQATDFPAGMPSLRPPRPVSLPDSLANVAEAQMAELTDVVLASDEHSGSCGVVRLGALENGDAVAVKTIFIKRHESQPQYDTAALEKDMLNEARSATLLDQLGIGARFHGLTRDEDGRLNLAFDLVPGDFSGTPVTPETLSDVETILQRLASANIEVLGDFQVFRTPEGRLVAIDPNGMADYVDKQIPGYPSAESSNGEYTRFRAS